jgi:hypothetical protein
MCDTGHQPPERCELFGFDQGALGFLRFLSAASAASLALRISRSLRLVR